MKRRSFLKGILAAGIAPVFIKDGISREILMPVREIKRPIMMEFLSSFIGTFDETKLSPALLQFNLTITYGFSIDELRKSGFAHYKNDQLIYWKPTEIITTGDNHFIQAKRSYNLSNLEVPPPPESIEFHYDENVFDHNLSLEGLANWTEVKTDELVKI